MSGFAGGVFVNEQGRQRQPLPFSVDGKARMEGHLLAQESITNEKRASVYKPTLTSCSHLAKGPQNPSPLANLSRE